MDKLFTSPRDNQPFEIAYRGGASGGISGLVAWEKTGSGGKRFVADSLGKVEEIDEATFTQRRGSTPSK